MRKKISSLVDFENMPTENLLMYIDFYRDKVDEGEPMDDYYRNMLELAEGELAKRTKGFK